MRTADRKRICADAQASMTILMIPQKLDRRIRDLGADRLQTPVAFLQIRRNAQTTSVFRT
jgi:hypothetical protein